MMATPTGFCFADENGEIVDGDEILAIAALDLLKSNQLRDKRPGRHRNE